MSSAKKKTLVLLDAHAIIHRAYHALPPLTSPSGEPVGAVYGLVTMVLKLIKDLDPDYIVAAYDLPGPTHRHEVYAAYKGTRPKVEDDLAVQLALSRKALEAFGIPVYEAPGFEADDVIGTIASATKKKYHIIIASGDMDTLQLVDGSRVRVYTLRKGIQDTVLYDEGAVVARYGFGPEHIPDYKGIAGDPSDNIIGIPGIGEKGATDLIKAFGSVEQLYAALNKNKDAVVERGMTARLQRLVLEHQDEAEFSKVLATIRTDAPIIFAEPQPLAATLSAERLVDFCNAYGFRSLVLRMRQVVAHRSPLIDRARSKQPNAPELSAADQALLKECVVMTWLLNPDRTNPTFEDVQAVTKEQRLPEAHARLKELLAAERLDHVYEKIEKPLIPVLDAMAAIGVAIDAHHLAQLSAEYHTELDRRAAAIHAAAGGPFNINSPRQLGEVLFTKLGLGNGRQKKTATGQLSTKESELQKLATAHPIVEEILAYRELAKLLGTYIDAIPPLLDSGGRLHTTFLQTGAATGRIATRDPGLQNIPIKTDLGRRIRTAFIAPPGRVLLGCDYSQIELRLAAILSGDEKLTSIFMRGEDVHTAVAAQVFGVANGDVTKEMRRRAKVINFGILYGMGVTALRENLGTDRAEAQAFYTRYFETYHGVAEYLERTKEHAARTGYTTTLFGRKRFFPGMRSTLPYIRAQAERMAINAPLQGTQADIIKIAMVRIHDAFNAHFAGRAALVMQIHDELVMEVDESIVHHVAAEVKAIMEGVLTPTETRGVPITVSAEAGPTWGQMQPL